jgi:hypothetical protein
MSADQLVFNEEGAAVACMLIGADFRAPADK